MKSLRILALALGLFAIAGCGGSSSAPSDPEYRPEEFTMPPVFGGMSRERLARGEPLPKLECAGWFNGEPKPFDAKGPAVHVVDVWSTWCPECQKSAPGLIELHAKYAKRGVQFISVSDMPVKLVDKYVRDNSIPWPCGYGLAVGAVADMGVVNRGMAAVARGYVIAPTIFVVAADGKVFGSDESARWKHRPREEIVVLMEKVIDEALAAAK